MAEPEISADSDRGEKCHLEPGERASVGKNATVGRWSPDSDPAGDTVIVDLESCRAGDMRRVEIMMDDDNTVPLRLTYDFERHCWVVEKDTAPAGDDPQWQEVVLIPGR